MTRSDPDMRRLMDRALALAERGMQSGAGGPFGALVVRRGVVVAEGFNQVTSSNDPTAHAEIVAIRAATKTLANFELRGCILVTTCEPCPMCLAAAYWSRLDHIYYANTRAQAAAIGFDDRLIYEEIARPIGDRTLPMTRLTGPRDEDAFAQWRSDPDKLRY